MMSGEGDGFHESYAIVMKSGVVPVHAMTAHGRMEVYIHAFFFLDSGWGERPPSLRGLFPGWE